MSSQLESMQSVLPPSVSPGWNDPPNLGGADAPTASNRLANLRKRIVDPSISSVSGGGGMITQQPVHGPDHGYPHATRDVRHHEQHQGYPTSEQYGVVPTPVSVGIPTSAPHPGVTTTQAPTQIHMQPQQQYTHHLPPSHSNPVTSAHQLPHTTITPNHLPQQPHQQHYSADHSYSQEMPTHPYSQVAAGGAVQPQGMHPNSVQSAGNQLFFQQQQPPIYRPPAANSASHYFSSSTTFSKTSSLPSAITTLSTSSPPMPSSTTQREVHRPVFDAFTVAGGGDRAKSGDPFLVRSHSNPNQHNTHVAWSASSADSVSTTKASSSSSSPTASRHAPTFTTTSLVLHTTLPNDVIASLPNCVLDTSRRTSVHDAANYRRLQKAPGDVSMSRQQLILCLSAASKKLSPNIHRGVQLRISELKDAMEEGRISERCLKSLNYVVDSIDREKYDDAHTFFDRLRVEFPDEMGPWAQQGIRLLINELRRPSSRIGSAGPHLRSQ